MPLRRRLQGPLYFPAARAALAPRGVSAARVTSIMEFQRPDAPPDRRALAATAARAADTDQELDDTRRHFVTRDNAVAVATELEGEGTS